MPDRTSPSGGFLDAVVRASRDVVLILDAGGHVRIPPTAEARYPRLARALGSSASLRALEEIYELRRPGGDALPFQEWPASRVLAGEAVEDVEVEVRLKDESGARTVTMSGEPFRDPVTGELQGGMLILHDLTEQRRAEAELAESEGRFRQLADAMPQLVWTADAAGVVDYYNDRVREFMGIVRQPDGSWRWSPVLHPDDEAPTVRAWEEAVRTGAVYEIAHRVRRADGRLRWYLSRGVPVRDESGRVVRWYGTATDIHAQKEAEEALRRADARKDAFLAMLSHELRNPLAPIRNGVGLLRRAPAGSAQAERALDAIDRQATHLTRLVDDLLDVTRIARGKIRLRTAPLDLSELVARAVDDHRTAFADRQVGLALRVPDAPLRTEGDADRLLQVTGNLLDNAAKFTPPGGRVTVQLERTGPEARLLVRDDGAGMDAATLDRLFQPFEQADASLARGAGGLGLGLALVKSLVEMHGGRVEARSEGLGRGSELEVRLPLSEEAAPRQAGTKPPARSRGPQRTVLIVEDVVDTAESLRDLLELEGHRVEVAFHGGQGVERARTLRPDVVICDLGLPEVDGYEVARRLRADDATRSVFLVALSGYAGAEDVASSRAAGFDRHLSKPPDLDALLTLLAEAPSIGR